MARKKGEMATTEEEIIQVEENKDSWVDTPKREEKEKDVPERTSAKWSDWLMKQFDKSELYTDDKQSYPKVHGLRRLAHKFLGTIIRSQCHPVVATPEFCSFIYEIEYINTDGQKIICSDAADVHENNSDEFFRVFPSAIAVTRAEARALRKALGLVTCSAEELGPRKKRGYETKEKEVNPDETVQEKINVAQKSYLSTHCKSLNVNPWCLINTGGKKYNAVDELSYNDAQKFCQTLGEWIRNRKTMEKTLEEKKIELKPFSQSWENDKG